MNENFLVILRQDYFTKVSCGFLLIVTRVLSDLLSVIEQMFYTVRIFLSYIKFLLVELIILFLITMITDTNNKYFLSGEENLVSFGFRLMYQFRDFRRTSPSRKSVIKHQSYMVHVTYDNSVFLLVLFQVLDPSKYIHLVVTECIYSTYTFIGHYLVNYS